MNKPNRLTLRIVLLPILLVVISVGIITYLNIRTLKKHIAIDISGMSQSYINENKLHITNEVQFIVNSIKHRQNQIELLLDNMIKSKVDEAIAVAESVYQKYKDKLTDTEIQDIIKSYLYNSNFPSKNGYFFAVDLNTNKIIVHKNRNFIGYNMDNHQDAKGLYVLKLEKKLLAESDGAFHNMYFSKPDADKEYNKRVYVREFKPYNWMIGTGEYYDEMEQMSQNKALSSFNNISIDRNSSTFIVAFDKDKDGKLLGTTLMNTHKPEVVGKKVPLDIKDKTGKAFFREFLDKTKDGKGAFVEYWFSKEDKSEPVKKLAYVYYQKDWDWLIGSGFYFDDIINYSEGKKQEFIKTTGNNIRNSILLALALSLGAGIIAYFIAMRINNTINRYNKRIEDMNSSLAKEIEIELEKNRKQEEIIHEQKKLADMGQMLNAIAHQWRQPLNILGLYGQDIAERYKADLLNDDFMAEFKKTHMDMVLYLSATIDDFRKFFKPDQKKEAYDLIEQINSLVDLLKVQFINNNIHMETSCRCDEESCSLADFAENSECKKHSHKIYGYPGELKQSLVNILYNAKDAIEEALTEKSINKGVIKIHLSFDEGSVTLKISNNGIAIPEAVKANIFQPYFTTKEEGRGTGLGLYIAKTTIEKNMDGILSIDSDTSETTFIIQLPVAEHKK